MLRCRVVDIFCNGVPAFFVLQRRMHGPLLTGFAVIIWPRFCGRGRGMTRFSVRRFGQRYADVSCGSRGYLLFVLLFIIVPLLNVAMMDGGSFAVQAPILVVC